VSDVPNPSPTPTPSATSRSQQHLRKKEGKKAKKARRRKEAKKKSANDMAERLAPNHLRLLFDERAFVHDRGNEKIVF
jgi:hypothetical protein